MASDERAPMRILLIAPAFYDYHHHIVRELERRGHEVRFFAERPSRWIYSPAKKLPARWRRSVFDQYLRSILNAVRGEVFDRILLVRGEIVAPWFVEALRQRQPRAQFVMYQWDSYRVTDFRQLIGLFDTVSTFDSEDAKELGIGYLPLFHTPAYRLKDAPAQPAWDLVFVGSFHDARYRAMLDVRTQCQEKGRSPDAKAAISQTPASLDGAKPKAAPKAEAKSDDEAPAATADEPAKEPTKREKKAAPKDVAAILDDWAE